MRDSDAPLRVDRTTDRDEQAVAKLGSIAYQRSEPTTRSHGAWNDYIPGRRSWQRYRSCPGRPRMRAGRSIPPAGRSTAPRRTVGTGRFNGAHGDDSGTRSGGGSPDGLRRTATTRRSFVGGLGGLVVGTAAVDDVAANDADDAGSLGYGAGGYGGPTYGGDENDATGEPSLSDYTDEEGVVQTDGLIDAIADWRAADLDSTELLDVITAWRQGDALA